MTADSRCPHCQTAEGEPHFPGCPSQWDEKPAAPSFVGVDMASGPDKSIEHKPASADVTDAQRKDNIGAKDVMPASAPREWTIEKYKEYVALSEKIDSKVMDYEDSPRFQELSDFFAPLDNRTMVLDAFDAVVKERDELQRWHDKWADRATIAHEEVEKLREQVAQLEVNLKISGDQRGIMFDHGMKVIELTEQVAWLEKEAIESDKIRLARSEEIERLEGELKVMRTEENAKIERLECENAELQAYKAGGILDFAGINAELRKQLDKLQAENARLLERYNNIDLANTELTKNDHVTFGKLYNENADLKGRIDAFEKEYERLRSQTNSWRIQIDRYKKILTNLSTARINWGASAICDDRKFADEFAAYVREITRKALEGK